VIFSDASAPDKPGRNQMAESRKAQQARTARTAEATTIGQGGIIVKGGNVVVEEGGSIKAEYPSGRAAALFGPQVKEGTDIPFGHGLLIQADDDAEGRDIFRARYYNGERLVYIGQTPGDDASGAVDVFVSDSVRTGIHSHGDELRLQTHHGGNLLQFVNGDLRMIVDLTWDANVTGNLDFDAQGTALIQSNTTMQLLCEGEAALGGTTGTFLQPASGSGTANMRMDTSTGRVTYVTSTERVKSDIQDLQVDPGAVLQLRPRTWLPGPTTRQCPEWMHAQHPEGDCHAGELVDPPADAVREVGFVAEELDALGLHDFVEYGTDGLPMSIRYDRMTAALVPLVQQQQAQIDALTAQLQALADRVTALEPTQEA
jgi:hypothetical protein